MSRFTLVTSTPTTKEYRSPKQSLGGELTDLHRYLQINERLKDCIYYEVLPGVFVVLSNGLSKSDHYKLYEEINAKYPGVRVISVVHESPLYAIIKASKILTQTDFYYEEGIEGDYYVGAFAPLKYSSDIVIDLMLTYSTTLSIAMLLLNSGSLPLEVSINGVIAALNRSSIDRLESLRSRVYMSIGVDRSARRALEKIVTRFLA